MIVLMMIAGFVVPTKEQKPVETVVQNVGAIKDEYTDYKFWYIKRDDNGFIIEAAIRFYEGHYEKKMVTDKKTKVASEKDVYVRTTRLSKSGLSHLGDVDFGKERTGADVVIYDQKDFGKIKTDDELRLFLNKQIKKDTGRKINPDQSEVLDIKKVK